MPLWKVYLLRFVSAATIAIGIAGLLFDLIVAIRVIFRFGVYRGGIHSIYVFLIVCTIAVAWFACCLLSGIYLSQQDIRGYRLAWSIALFQIIYSISIPLLLLSKRGTQVFEDVFLAFVGFDNGLSLKYSVVLLLLLGVFFRKTDFRGERIAEVINSAGGASEKLGNPPGMIPLVRGLGLSNVIFGLLGIIFGIVDVVASYRQQDILSRTGYSFRISLVGAAINLALVVALVFAGYLLIKLDRRGVICSNCVLSAEILYWTVSTVAPPMSNFIDFALAPQVLTAYPLIALPLINWGAKRLDRVDGWKNAPSTQLTKTQ